MKKIYVVTKRHVGDMSEVDSVWSDEEKADACAEIMEERTNIDFLYKVSEATIDPEMPESKYDDKGNYTEKYIKECKDKGIPL